MTSGARVPSGQPPINFLVHQLRSGEAGASLEFEQMLALLVQTLNLGEARLIFPVRGDWGIDVLVGELDGRVTIWQAKYFANGVRRHQLDNVRKSFDSACRAAGAHGYRIERWVLCIPCSMEAPALQKWQQWRDQQQLDSGIVIDLWDETKLRKLLMRPAAAHVVQAFYHPYRDPRPPAAAQIRLTGGDENPRPWREGDELRIDAGSYLLHAPVEQYAASDRSWLWREASAEQIEPEQRRVRLRQVEIVRPGASGAQRRDGLLEQGDLLSIIDGRSGLPRRLGLYRDSGTLTLVTAQPVGPTWRQAYEPGGNVPDRLGAAAVLAAMVPVCAALVELHRHGYAHRAVGPDSIVLTGKSRRGELRDAGLAGLRPLPGEGPDAYRAAEQRQLGHGDPGPHTDVYQVAAVVYHTITGHPPAPARNPPVAATLSRFPTALDEVLARALDPDPARRPTMPALAAALRAGRAELSKGVAP